jgi:predicted nucleic acid-binding protein
MARIFVDSGVLVAAARGEYPFREAARELLSDPNHTFLTSPFVYLETAAKARYHQRVLELASYQIFFHHAEWARDVERTVQLGTELAKRYGVGPMDALHVAAANLLGADELVTVEKPGKSIDRVRTLRVAYLAG